MQIRLAEKIRALRRQHRFTQEQLAESLGLDALVEIGPGKALSGFVKKTVPELPVYAVETAAELEQLTETLKGASL